MRTKVLKFSTAVIFFLTSLFIYSQEPGYKWVCAASEAISISTDIDTLGNIVNIGKFSGNTMNFGSMWISGSPANEATSMYIAKYTSTGKLMWAQSIFATNASSAVVPVKVAVNISGDIAVMAYLYNVTEIKLGNLYIPLKSNFDKLLVAKYNKLGRLLWFRILEARSTEMTYLEGADLVMDNPGNVYCTGSFAGDSLITGKEFVTGNGQNILLFAAQFNRFGLLSWLKTCDYESSAEITSITGRFIMLTTSGILLGGNYIGNRNYIFNNDTLVGDTSLSGYIAKMDYIGNFLWAHSFTGTNTQFVDDMATDLAGNVYVSVLFNSPSLIIDTGVVPNSSPNYDLCVAKFDADGNLLWKESFDVQIYYPEVNRKNSILKADLAGDIIIVTPYMGKTVLSNTFSRPNANEGTRDLLIFRMSHERVIQWVQTVNSMEEDWINSVAFDRFGSVYILCPVPPVTVTLDTYTITDVLGYGGFYIAKINALGMVRFVKPNFNSSDGSFDSKDIISDMFGNIYLLGNFTGNNNALGNLFLQTPEKKGLFFSKLSYYTNVSGRVLNKNGTPMDGGMVKLYGYTRFQRSPISDSAIIKTDGSYLLTNVPFGRYIIYAYPRKISNPLAVPTYYPGGANWEEASSILIETSEPVTGIDIQLKEIPQANGSATMGGMIFEADTTNIFKSSSEILAKPIKKADVILRGRTKSSGNVIAYTTTDDNGDFAFFNIPDGDYTVEVDIPGIPHDSYHNVTVTGGELIMNLDYLVGEEYIYAQNGPNIVPSVSDNQEKIVLYPNPCNGSLYIKNEKSEDLTLQVEIYNLAGICLYSESIDISSSISKLDVSSLKEGLYIIKIKGNTIHYHQKLMIK